MKYTKIKEHMVGMPLMTMEGQTKIVAIFKGDDKKYTVCTMDGLYLFYERNIEDSKLDWKPCHTVPIEIVKQLAI